MGYLGATSHMSEQNRERPLRPTEETIILAVETSSRVGSTALARGANVLEERRLSGPMQHSSELFPTIATLLNDHGYVPGDIDQVHIATGPGSFTGLRIAVALAKAMHLAAGVRIVTVDSLDVVAANLAIDGLDQSGPTIVPDRICALFDAKRGQFYASVYQRIDEGTEKTPGDAAEDPGYRIPAPGNGLWQKTVPDVLLTARQIVESIAGPDRLGLLGDGLFYHRDQFPTERTVILPEQYWSPHAANVHRLGHPKALAGRFADPLSLAPFYLRGPEVTLRKSP